jgi:hypothetical protein
MGNKNHRTATLAPHCGWCSAGESAKGAKFKKIFLAFFVGFAVRLF